METFYGKQVFTLFTYAALETISQYAIFASKNH